MNLGTLQGTAQTRSNATIAARRGIRQQIVGTTPTIKKEEKRPKGITTTKDTKEVTHIPKAKAKEVSTSGGLTAKEATKEKG